MKNGSIHMRKIKCGKGASENEIKLRNGGGARNQSDQGGLSGTDQL